MRDADLLAAETGRVWFVFFLPGRVRHWWAWFAWGRWKHVGCFRFDRAAGCWLLFQYGADGVMAEAVAREGIGNLVRLWHRAGGRVVAIDEGERVSALRNPWLNCVGLVKSLTRRGSGALSPSGLWRCLHREGCEPAWEALPEEFPPDGIQDECAGTGQGTGSAAKGGRGAFAG